MALVFTAERGIVKVVDEPFTGANIQLVNVDGWGGFTAMNAIITRCTVSQQCNFQFLHTLGRYIYVYVFGDRMGMMGLSGLAFHTSCDNKNTLGVAKVLDFYKQNRLTQRETPVKTTLGVGPTLEGFLVGGSCDVADPRDRIWQFDLQFSLIPPQD